MPLITAPKAHEPWCAGCDGEGCYTSTHDTPLGPVWVQATPTGPVAMLDPAVDVHPLTAADIDAIRHAFDLLGAVMR
jgi:hypothetical protein